jgi:hypothetical protein
MEILSSGEQGLVETMSYRELLAARHNAFLTMDIETLVRIAMESRIRADASIAKDDSDSLVGYRTLINGTQKDLAQLREEN